ncbi:MAG: hypothetical protein H6732_17325 [Alphaproteobacteria bacterium]|nr:hypothetical protein [Alphaproteobacteria bacterium]
MAARVRVGTVGYLNARPLTLALDPERFEVIADHPTGIAARLARGEVDVALAPVAAVLGDPELRIVPGFCIGADGPVQSVGLFAEIGPEAWTEVVLDGQSRTSRTLARLLLRHGPLAELVRPDLVITDVPPGTAPARLGGTVAGLVIGDPARTLPSTLRCWDLGEIWTAWTGKPFVFAVWACRADLPADVVEALQEAGRAGLAARERTWSGDDLAYLTTHIRYELDERALMGLRRYAALAARAGLLPSELVQIHGPLVTRRARRADLERLTEAAVGGVALAEDDLVALLREGRDSELGMAAQVVRSRHRAVGEGSYLVEHRVGADRVAGGGPAFEAELADAVAHDAGVVRLHGLAWLGASQRRARLRAVQAAGLQAVGLDLAEVPAAAHEEGGDLRATLADLAAAGLASLDWRVDEALVDVALLRAAVHAGLRVDASVQVTRPDALVRQLVGLRALQAETGALASLAVHLALPEGALVEPGRPTPSAWLRALAVARLALPDLPHVVASPASQGVDLSQVALLVGADDLGPVGTGPLEAATGSGAAFAVGVAEAERALRVAGLEPVRRDARWHTLGGALTPLRKVRPVQERADAAR